MPDSPPLIRQPVVVVLGHVDSGKCVSEDTLLQLADGRILEAKEVFDRFRSGEPVRRPDGVVHEAKDLKLLSVDRDGEVVSKPVSHVWKLRTDKLIEVKTKAGYNVRTTPEHKFLVMLPSGDLNYVEAERLTLGDFLILPAKSPGVENDLGTTKARILEMLSDDFLVRVNPELNSKIALLFKGGVVWAGRELGDKALGFHVRKGYYRVSVLRRIAEQLGLDCALAYESILEIKFASKKRRVSHQSPWVRLPKTGTEFEALLYLVGLLYGDGVAASAELSNISQELIDEYERCIGLAFGVGATQAWRRTSFIVSHKGGKTVVRFLNEAFSYPIRDKTRILNIPETVCMMPDRFVALFLRGFFDAEGYVQEGRSIGVGCESKELMRRLPMVLQRFGCLAYFGKKGHSREVVISGKNSTSAFVERIGFHSKAKMEAARRRLSLASTNRVFELTPIPGEFARTVRVGRQVVWNRPFQLSSYEGYQRLSKDFLSRVSEVIPSYVNEGLSRIIENFCMVQVTGLQTIGSEATVYDFTIQETHNFLANGLVIHNTSLLDKMRGTGVQAREAGGITQEIGASFFPIATLKSICGGLLDRAGGELKVPGILVIDTPGHEIFSNLRQRGGSAADIAILVVDVMKGLENQTIESIEILKQRKVPFLVALNKIDTIKGWKKGAAGLLSEVLGQQFPEWNDEYEERLYNLVGALSKLGFQSDAYYRVKEFRTQVSIVPVSARSGAGIPELLAVLIGLAQQFLKERLTTIAERDGGRGIILELQEETGLGQTANVILTEGRLRVGDSILLVRRSGAVRSKVKALFLPKPLDEMRDPRDKFTPVDSISAAAGVKLVSTDLEGVIPGTSVVAFREEAEFAGLKDEAEKELEKVVLKTDKMGVIVKAGSIGGLEALMQMLGERGISVRLADVGDISRNDLVEAQVVKEHDPYLAAVLGFDVKLHPDAREVENGRVFTSSVIYEVIDDYVNWATKTKEENEKAALSSLTLPAKMRALPGAFFRRNDPAVFGVEVLAGRIRPKTRIMNAEGKELGTIEQMQENAKSIDLARIGEKVAISVRGPTLGRQIKENDEIYTYPMSHEVKLLRNRYLGALSQDDLEALEEIVKIRSIEDPLYGF